jgi:hypothetical protein
MNQRVWMLGAMWIAGLLGCAHTTPRLQSEDEGDRDKGPEVKVIRDVTSAVENASPISICGIGLVVGLEDTGGGAPPGALRKLLEVDLQKRRVPNVKELLASKSTSLVIISGQIPAGARKDEPLDVVVTVPRECKTTSLRGGRLLPTTLYNYTSKKLLDPKFTGADAFLQGHAVARAEGPLVAGFTDGDEANRLREARIWEGGRSLLDRPFYLVLGEGKQFARIAQAVAEAINTTFNGDIRGATTDLAVAKTKALVYLTVPAAYRLNMPRYLRVVRLIPLWDAPDKRIAYSRSLEKQLLDPAHSVTAALRLEALGKDSEPSLKLGLKSDHPLVRFCAAEALAYLGSPSCAEVLARTIEEQPLLRAFSLTALASLDEAISRVELRKLLASRSAETRYGAFQALRALDEHDDLVQGEYLDESFWLHRVAPGSTPLVHVSSSRRAEIVLFGEDAYLVAPFPILAGEFTVTAARGDSKCTIDRVSVHHGRSQRQCSLKLQDVITNMADMGGNYSDIIEMLRRADHLQCLSCKVMVDALPQRVDVVDLAKAGAKDPELLKTHPEILDAQGDFGPTPNLFDRGLDQRSSWNSDGKGDAERKDAKAKNSGTEGERDAIPLE